MVEFTQCCHKVTMCIRCIQDGDGCPACGVECPCTIGTWTGVQEDHLESFWTAATTRPESLPDLESQVSEDDAIEKAKQAKAQQGEPAVRRSRQTEIFDEVERRLDEEEPEIV